MRSDKTTEATRGATGRELAGEAIPPEEAKLETLIARAHIGRRLRNRRKELSLSATEVARSVGWTSQFYGQIEAGTNSAGDIRAWVQLARALQLKRAQLLEQVWETRDGFTILLPPKDDPRRRKLIKLALDIFAHDIPDLP